MEFPTSPSPILKTGLLCNPLSGRLRKRMDSIRRMVPASPELSVREASIPSGIGQAVDDLISEDIELLVIAGGDGTVQAVLTHLFTSQRSQKLPLISIIPGGTTNMTAADLGVRGGPVRNLKLLYKLPRKGVSASVVKRSILCIERNNKPPVYGMFFGVGIITEGVKYFQQWIKPTGATGEFASALVIIRFLATLFRRRDKEISEKTSENDCSISMEGDCTMILATTLDRLLLGMRPYWGKEIAPIHYTSVGRSPRKFWRSVIPLISGRGGALAREDGYYSLNCLTRELDIETDFIVDGELFSVDTADGPLRISATEPIDFLCLS